MTGDRNLQLPSTRFPEPASNSDSRRGSPIRQPSRGSTFLNTILVSGRLAMAGLTLAIAGSSLISAQPHADQPSGVALPPPRPMPSTPTSSTDQQDQAPPQDSAGENLLDAFPAWSAIPLDEVLWQAEFGTPDALQGWTLLGGGWEQLPNHTPPLIRMTRKESDYKPPVRSPLHLALAPEPMPADLVLEAICRSTHKEYPHQDVCFFLGHQDPGHFYYVHLARNMDPHANQIFLVDGADRRKISATTTEGVVWGDQWHHIRIERRSATGALTVWFDNMEQPVMTAVDQTFADAGRVGFGSFDDTAEFAAFRILRVRESSEPKENPDR